MRHAGFVFRKSLGWLLMLGILLCTLLYVFSKRRYTRRAEENEVITLPPREPDAITPLRTAEVPSVSLAPELELDPVEDPKDERTNTLDLELASLEPVTSGLIDTASPSQPDGSQTHDEEPRPTPPSEPLIEQAHSRSEDGSTPAVAPVEIVPPVEVAYCVKCRKKQTMLAPERSVTKNGRAALVGRCTVCGTKLFRFVSA